MLFGVLAAICATASIFVSQYYNKGDFNNALRIQRLRIVSCLIVSLSLALVALINPGLLIRTALGSSSKDPIDYKNIVNYGEEYIRIIALT
jgi:Na+-driven multidrug efflux pump